MSTNLKPYRPSLPTIPSSYYGDATRYTGQAGIRERIEDLIGATTSNSLPMYKDKPNGYPQRKPSNTGNKVGLVLVIITGAAWFLGLIPGVPSAMNLAMGGSNVRETKLDKAVWARRKQAVVDAFTTSWDHYAEYAWGMDEFHPISRTSKNLGCEWQSDSCPPTGWIIVDALDTAIMMNLTSRVAQAREWISTSLDFSKVDSEMSTFETTIRILGGLLSAHYLSTNFPHLAPLADDDLGAKGEDLYIEKAVDLADRLLGAFDTPTGIPLSSCILNSSTGVGSRGDGGMASTAEATTLQLELKYVSKLTGEPLYWQRAEQVMAAVDAPRHEGGLVPIYIDPQTGQFRQETIRLGSRGDSYYEYLIKQYLQTGRRETVYLDMWNEALLGVKQYLITWGKDSNFTVLAERQTGLHQPLTGKMDHLVCFLPGAIALALTNGAELGQAKTGLGEAWTREHDQNLRLAEELAKTCYGMYLVTPTGLAPEITYFELDLEGTPSWNTSDEFFSIPQSADLVDGLGARWRFDYDIRRQDVHNLQRPETIESLFYLWRITGNPMYREWGWKIFEAFLRYTAVHDSTGKVVGYTSIGSVMDTNTRIVAASSTDGPAKGTTGRDNMEGFWLAETLKYLYLLFSDEVEDWNDLGKIVFNTEAHIFPRFDIGADQKIWNTGWQRKSREQH